MSSPQTNLRDIATGPSPPPPPSSPPPKSSTSHSSTTTSSATSSTQPLLPAKAYDTEIPSRQLLLPPHPPPSSPPPLPPAEAYDTELHVPSRQLLLPPPPPPSSPPPQLSPRSPPPSVPEVDRRFEKVIVPTLRLPAAHSDSSDYHYRSDRNYTPPHTTPHSIKPFRYSEHIHKDRHIFLKGASIGIGGGGRRFGDNQGNGQSLNSADLQGIIPWVGDLKNIKPHECSFDEFGNIFFRGQCIRLGSTMALGQERLPALHRVQLALSANGDGRNRLSTGNSPIHNSLTTSSSMQASRLANRRARPFNEQLNTYVDTQKRIRAVQCLEDLYRQSPAPTLPYLATPNPKSPRQPRPPPKPARVMLHIPRVTDAQPYPPRIPHPTPTLTRHATAMGLKQGHAKNAVVRFSASTKDESSTVSDATETSAAATTPAVAEPAAEQLPPPAASTSQNRGKMSGGTRGGAASGGLAPSVGEFTPAGITLLNSGSHPNSTTSTPRPDQQLVSELLAARNMLQKTSASADLQPIPQLQQSPAVNPSGSRDYVNYFLTKEGGEGGTFGRLFESYPKRMITFHPGRAQRQRTDIVSRSKMRQLLQ